MKTYITKSYDLKYRFKSHPHIQVDQDKNIINTLTGRVKKIVLNGRSLGVWIDSKTFIVYKNLNSHLEKIPQEDCPF